MAKPATVRDLVDAIRLSRLVDEPRLAAYLRATRRAGPDRPTPDRLLGRMVTDGLLTRFQADQLALGRWRGLVLGDYRVLEQIGAGGMGNVYLAEHAALGRRVAVKVLAAGPAADPDARERIRREAQAAAALSHPNIVRVLDVAPDHAPPYLVMEYIDGVSLQAAVARTGTFDAGTAAYLGRQVALALQRTHEVGLVHRDIKPANLLVDRTGLVKVLDLGIVRMGCGALTLRRTERQLLGTADYLAPEQALNSHAVDARADLYALGGTLYFLLAGHPPFPNGTAPEKVLAKQAGDPPPIDRLRPDVCRGLAAVVRRMMARRPDDRYPTPLAAAEALTPFARPDDRFPGRLFADRSTTDDRAAATTGSGGPPGPATGDATDVVVITDLHPPLTRTAPPAPADTPPPPVRQRLTAATLAGLAAILLTLAAIAYLRAAG